MLIKTLSYVCGRTMCSFQLISKKIQRIKADAIHDSEILLVVTPMDIARLLASNMTVCGSFLFILC